MPAFVCDDSLRLSIEKANRQSQYLIELLDKAYVEATRGDSIQDLGLLIDGLVDYATEHFHLIELMPPAITDAFQTEIELKAFAERVSELQIAYYSKRHSVSLRALSFLINWLDRYNLKLATVGNRKNKKRLPSG